MEKWAKPRKLAEAIPAKKRGAREALEVNRKKQRLPTDEMNSLVIQTTKLVLSTAKTVRLHQGALVHTVLLDLNIPVCLHMEQKNT
eukprot:13844986-Heterocapsa_arctica.AAC.1